MFVDRDPDFCSVAPQVVEIANPLIARLNKFVTLDTRERAAITAMTRTRRTIKAHETLVHEGIRPDRVCLILRGAAYRYRFLANGRRQIFGYLLPGDLCDTHFIILNEADHSVGMLCDSEIATIPLATLMSTVVEHPRIERALLMMSLVDGAISREWLLNVGQRDAYQKLAHFFCEMTARYQSLRVDHDDDVVAIPLTQMDLADTMGLTVVHVNRVLQRFRHEGLLNWSRRHVEIPDHQRLRAAAGFDDAYLRLRNVPAQPKQAAYG